MKTNGEDKRPDPKPRKNAALWQSYLWWNSLVELRKRGTLRVSSIEAGKSNLDAQFEIDMLGAVNADALIDQLRKTMINYGKTTGPVWSWLTSIKGLGEGSLAAQLVAQIDDINRYPTISKLWRFAGWAVIDGEIDRCKKGEKSPYNRRLKSLCWLIVDQFIRQQTPAYADLYYAEKARQHALHPEKIKTDNGKWQFNDGHLHNRAIRKVAKIFLQHVWLVWRTSEGLPVSQPWIIAQGGHAEFVPPPNWPISNPGVE